MKRISLFIEGLDHKQTDIVKEIKGPPKNIAFDGKNMPTKAAQGFARANGLNVSDLIVKKNDTGEYIYALKKEKGIETKKILKSFIPELLESLYLPVSMRWMDGSHNFIRPVHSILSLYGSDLIAFNIFGIDSSKFKHSADLNVYKNFLKKEEVVIDGFERKNIILKKIKYFEDACNEKVLQGENLLNESANIVENPRVILGCFDPGFIDILPKDVIYTIVAEQQKCFPFLKSGRFLIVTDGKDNKQIISGYEKVMNARLTDAKFFYDEDKKNLLQNNLEKMKKIIYHEQLGSMWDRVNRITILSSCIAGDILGKRDILDIVKRISMLSKADLITHMVSEFSSLAGIMGKEYSLLQGEDNRVAAGIYDHYLPRFAGDNLPQNIEGAIVGLSDRLDLISGCFIKGLIPSGSQDPYGLRRAAQGIVAIIIGKNMEIPLNQIVLKSIDLYGANDYNAKNLIMDFIKQRLKNILISENVKYDICDAVLQNAEDLVSSYCKAFIISKSIKEDWLKGIILTQDRISRIAKKVENSQFDENGFIEDAEKDMLQIYLKTKNIYVNNMNKKEYDKALNILKDLTAPVESYFDKILVMHEDVKLKNNRLALLKSIENMYLQFADFSKIVI